MLAARLADEVAGDPSSGRRWTWRSLRKVRAALARDGLAFSPETVRRVLRAQGIGPRVNRKRLEPRAHPDRDRQFRYIQRTRRRFAARGWPILSADCKKKELVGRFKNPGRTWRRQPHDVLTHDFPDDASYKAIPYGVYDVGRGDGHVYVGLDHETADLAVAAIAAWWRRVGRVRYPAAPRLLLLVDGGGGNDARSRRFKHQLQVRLADPFGLAVTVCHDPPGASKWNPIEHRLFSQISQTWAGTPLTSLALVLGAIRATRTRTGLRVGATLWWRRFPRGLSASDAQMRALALRRHRVLPHWNYTLLPRKSGKLFLDSSLGPVTK